MLSEEISGCGGMADAADSKSAARKGVRVQVPPSAVSKKTDCFQDNQSFSFIFYRKVDGQRRSPVKFSREILFLKEV